MPDRHKQTVVVTLVELLVVAILFILGAKPLPGTNQIMPNYRLRAEPFA